MIGRRLKEGKIGLRKMMALQQIWVEEVLSAD
jgi:hypothetical protein